MNRPCSEQISRWEGYLAENQIKMTTKKARLRKTKSVLGKTVSSFKNTRARRKALTEKRMAAAAREAAATIKAAAKPPVAAKKKKNTAAKAAPAKA